MATKTRCFRELVSFELMGFGTVLEVEQRFLTAAQREADGATR